MRRAILAVLIALCPLPTMTSAQAEEAESSLQLDTLVIDTIELNGVTVFTESDLEKVLELQPGDRLERRKIVRTARNLQELYRVHGYEQVRVQTRLNQKSRQRGEPLENILDISVSEGLPTRLSRIIITSSDPKYQSRLNSLASRFGLVEGDVFDQEKLGNGFRAFQDAVASYDFMGVRVTQDQVVTVTPDPERFEKQVIERTARWVDVHVKVDLGERVSFGFRGNQLFTATELEAMVEEQRLLGFSQDYQSRIQSRIIEEYRKNGYDRVQVEIFTFENAEEQSRHITYRIDEGPRVRLDEIRFDGNVIFTSEQLEDQFHDKAIGILSRGYYIEKDAQHTAELVVEWIKSQGYLAAKLISMAKNFSPKGDKVVLTFHIYEGEQTLVQGTDFRNVTVFTPDQIKSLIGNAEGRPLNLYDLSEGLQLLKAMYRDKGYLDFRILNEGTSDLVRYSDENRAAEIILNVEEGTQYRVSRIDITGLKKTKSFVVMRELLLSPGDVLEEGKWGDSETRLRRLGVFATVVIKAHPDPNRKDGKILQVVVEEGNPGLIAGGVGLRNDLGGRVFGQIAYTNLWGRNHTIALTGNANRRYGRLGAEFCPSVTQKARDPNKDHCFIEFNSELAYTFPWALLGETTFRPRITYERTQYRQFDANTAALALVLQRQLLKRPNLQAVLTYSFEKVDQFNSNDVDDDRSLTIGAITPALILDMRDSSLSPTKGIYSIFSYELARPELLSQVDPQPVAYSRTQYRIDGHIPLPKGIGAFLSFRTGLAYNFAKPPEGLSESERQKYGIPLIKQFALGGTGSLRGFKEQGLNLGDEFAILGYMSYVNYRAQIDFPFAGAMRFGPFVDMANLLPDNYSLTKDMHYGVGGGFHYRSPVGPVNFDIGVNPNPGPGDDQYKVHFSIGTI